MLSGKLCGEALCNCKNEAMCHCGVWRVWQMRLRLVKRGRAASANHGREIIARRARCDAQKKWQNGSLESSAFLKGAIGHLPAVDTARGSC